MNRLTAKCPGAVRSEGDGKISRVTALGDRAIIARGDAGARQTAVRQVAAVHTGLDGTDQARAATADIVDLVVLGGDGANMDVVEAQGRRGGRAVGDVAGQG